MSKQMKLIITQLVFLSLMTAVLHAGETQWLAVGDLHSWFHSAGCEIEVGRTHAVRDQQDGLRWPAQYRYQDTEAAKALWIGCKNYNDPIAGKVYNYKVVHAGPRVLDEQSEFMTQEFKLIGRFNHPLVYVDKTPSSKLDFMETVNEVDETLPADRVLVNIVNTSIGITMKRTIYAFARKDHSNYFIYDYVFTNTGIIDAAGTVNTQTLEDVVFYWQFRYAMTREACSYGLSWMPQSATWGNNTMNDVIYTHPQTGQPFRALISWNGKHSKWGGPGDNIGGPNYLGDGHLGAAQFDGLVTLHADKSPSDPSDDIAQPSTTWELDSDASITYGNNQFNASSMTTEYAQMTSGRPAQSHAERVGSGFADTYGSAGGFSTTAGYGPYTMAPGDSIHIVLAEGVSGLSREMCYLVGGKWVKNEGPFNLPDGGQASGSTAANDYKNAWVFTGRDSLIKTFDMAEKNYASGFNLPSPPPPPDQFNVSSGGDRIILEWSNSAEGWTGEHGNKFNGYRIYRAIHQPDTSYQMIFSCGPGTNHPEIVNRYDDTGAIRGFDYYYYISSVDDGSTADGVLESSKFYTMTNTPAHLLRPAGTKLEDIRIVPNPYNIRARDLQFGISAPDRIMFYNIPPFCEIKIYTERGDLIKTLVHDNGSGDEAWNSVTSSRQIVVSGIYLAYIKVTEDYVDASGKKLFTKGESIIKKLAIVR